MPAWIIAVAIASIAVTALLTWVLYRINLVPPRESEPGDD